MKNAISVGLTLALTLSVLVGLVGSILAGDSTLPYRPVLAAVSSPVDLCGRTSEVGAGKPSALTCQAKRAGSTGNSLAAVTCASNQWCCKHDDFSKGTCVKCCAK